MVKERTCANFFKNLLDRKNLTALEPRSIGASSCRDRIKTARIVLKAGRPGLGWDANPNRPHRTLCIQALRGEARHRFKPDRLSN
jgi:hypothetical protein